MRQLAVTVTKGPSVRKRDAAAALADYLSKPVALPLPAPMLLPLPSTPAQLPHLSSQTLTSGGAATQAGQKRSRVEASPVAQCLRVPLGGCVHCSAAAHLLMEGPRHHDQDHHVAEPGRGSWLRNRGKAALCDFSAHRTGFLEADTKITPCIYSMAERH